MSGAKIASKVIVATAARLRETRRTCARSDRRARNRRLRPAAIARPMATAADGYGERCTRRPKRSRSVRDDDRELARAADDVECPATLVELARSPRSDHAASSRRSCARRAARTRRNNRRRLTTISARGASWPSAALEVDDDFSRARVRAAPSPRGTARGGARADARRELRELEVDLEERGAREHVVEVVAAESRDARRSRGPRASRRSCAPPTRRTFRRRDRRRRRDRAVDESVLR